MTLAWDRDFPSEVFGRWSIPFRRQLGFQAGAVPTWATPTAPFFAPGKSATAQEDNHPGDETLGRGQGNRLEDGIHARFLVVPGEFVPSSLNSGPLGKVLSIQFCENQSDDFPIESKWYHDPIGLAHRPRYDVGHRGRGDPIAVVDTPLPACR